MTGLAMFVLSNDIHARMFGPVAREMRTLGWRSVALPLDAWYGQDAATAASAQQLELVEPETMGARPDGGFYGRPAPFVIRDAVRARKPLRRAIRTTRPDVVIVGNDRGLIEKAALAAARRAGAATVLVQDGAIGERSADEPDRIRRLWRRARMAVSGVLTQVGLGTYAATAYGLGGCDLVCVSGPEGRAAMLARGVPAGRLVEVGQPRYDEIGAIEPSSGHGVVWFTTPFAAQNLGTERQARQHGFVLEATTACRHAGIPFSVRPHPREAPAPYAEVVAAGATLRTDSTAAQVLATAEAAVVGISSVVDEAAILGVPVMVPAGPLADAGLEALLPPAVAYPRIASARVLSTRSSPGEATRSRGPPPSSARETPSAGGSGSMPTMGPPAARRQRSSPQPELAE